MRGDYHIVSKLLSAGNHPHMIVKHAYAVTTYVRGTDKDLALNNLCAWLDRIEPKWRSAHRLSWWSRDVK